MPYSKGIMREYSADLSIFHRVLDTVIILVVLWACTKGYGVTIGLDYGLVGLAAVISFLLFAELHVLYGSWRADSMGREAWTIFSTWALTCCAILALVFLGKFATNLSRVSILAWMILTPLMLVGERTLLRYTLRRLRKVGINTRSVAIVGGGKSASRLVDVILSSPWMGLNIEGVYDDGNTQLQNATYLQNRTIETLLQRVQDGEVDCVYIAYPMRLEEKISHLVDRLADSTVSVHIVPDIFVSELFRARWQSLGGIPLVSVFESPIYGSNSFLKRLEDIVLGSLILLLISPLMVAIALAVRLTSSGPALFKQRRYGLNGRVIEVWKFRSMKVQEDGLNVPQARRIDPRVTKLGAFLRGTSLDELPQFINVLQGTMSIVGPRPHAVAHNEEYRKLIHGYMLRHKVKPGITGWAQVNGWRGETDTTQKMEMRVQYDLEYINNWSLWFDLKIILMTVFGGMRGKNAY